MSKVGPGARGHKMPEEVRQNIVELVRAVGAAFYTDTVQLVLDLLLRFDYLRSDALAKQFGLVGHAVQAAVDQLHRDGLISKEQFDIDHRGHSKDFYFINFRKFVDVVTFRIFMMEKLINEKLSELNSGTTLRCPRCGAVYELVEVQGNIHEGKMYCARCSLIANRLADDVAFVEEIDMGQEKRDLENLEMRLRSQLGDAPDHPSIYTLLSKLGSATLSENMPNDHQRYWDEARASSTRREAGDQELAAGNGGGITAGAGLSQFEAAAESNDEELDVDYGIEVKLDANGQVLSSEIKMHRDEGPRDTALPDFLVGSKITGEGLRDAAAPVAVAAADEGEDEIDWED